MATHYAAPVENLLAGIAGPVNLGDPSFLGAKVHCKVKTIDLAVEDVNSGDTIVWFRVPKGSVPIVQGFLASATMGASATLDVGSATTAAKYRAAAVFTTANAPVLHGKAGALGVKRTAVEVIQSLVAVADLPSSGTLTFFELYTMQDGG